MSDSDSHCSICYEKFGREALLMDGPSNSDIETTCKHFFYTCCWEEMRQIAEYSDILCPLCRVDVTDWLLTHYRLDSKEEDESEEREDNEDEDNDD